MAQDGSELVRLDPFELRLIRNYRRVNETRQDTLIYFSDELVKLQFQDLRDAAANVVPILVNRK